MASPPSVGADGEAGPVVVTLTEDQVRRLGIRTVRAREGAVQYTIALPGSVSPAPDSYAEVAAPISGRIAHLARHEGETVEAGTLLAHLESMDLADLVARAIEAQAERDYQAQQVARLETLVERKIRAAATLERARADLTRAEALLKAAHARLHAIGVSEEQLEAWQRSDRRRPLLEIRAPIAGVIADHRIELGQPVTAYQTMMTLIDPSRVLVRGFLAPEEVDAVRVGDPVCVRSRNRPDQTLDAQVHTINPSLAEGHRSVTLNVLLDTSEGWPIPGQTVRLEVEATSPEDRIAIPLEAIEYEGEEATVFVRLDDRKWERRTLRVDRLSPEQAFISSGLREGEEVAVTQVFTLKALARFELYGEDETE